MSRRTFRLPLHPTDDSTIYALFTLMPPSGDGWNEPRDPGGPEFQGAIDVAGDEVLPDVGEWAERELYTKHLSDAWQIASDYDDTQREYAADMRRDRT